MSERYYGELVDDSASADTTSPPAQTVGPLLTIEQAAAYLGYTRRYMYRLVREKHIIPFRQRGKKCRILIPKEQLDAVFPERHLG